MEEDTIRHVTPRRPLPATIKRLTPSRCGRTERIFSNKQNVKLGCVTQKKSFHAEFWKGIEKEKEKGVGAEFGVRSDLS